MKNKLTKLDEARIVLLHNTGAINQRELSLVFKVSGSRIGEIIRSAKRKV